MKKQLTFNTIGGDVVEVTPRGKHYIEPCGYAYFPGTGPAGETCGSCAHITPSRRWHKCELARHKWTRSRRTDILVGAPACKYWKAP
jgi:hypothetical protein